VVRFGCMVTNDICIMVKIPSANSIIDNQLSFQIDAEESLIAHAESSRFVLFCHGTIFGCNHLSVCQMLSPG
jgi:hypothetical protein